VSVTVKQLRKMLEQCPDEAELTVIMWNNMALSVKHANLMRWRDGSGTPMVVFTPMGAHFKDEDFEFMGVTTVPQGPLVNFDTNEHKQGSVMNSKTGEYNKEDDPEKDADRV
jgi:hypothetical protein